MAEFVAQLSGVSGNIMKRENGRKRGQRSVFATLSGTRTRCRFLPWTNYLRPVHQHPPNSEFNMNGG